MATNWTAEDLKNLEEAIAQGIKEVKYHDKEIVYRSLDEMLQIRNEIRKCLGLVKCGGGRIFAKASKGIC